MFTLSCTGFLTKLAGNRIEAKQKRLTIGVHAFGILRSRIGVIMAAPGQGVHVRQIRLAAGVIGSTAIINKHRSRRNGEATEETGKYLPSRTAALVRLKSGRHNNREIGATATEEKEEEEGRKRDKSRPYIDGADSPCKLESDLYTRGRTSDDYRITLPITLPRPR